MVTHVDPARHCADRLWVKFQDELPVRLRNGELTGSGSGALGQALAVAQRLTAEGAIWQREHTLPEAELAQLRETAQRNLGRVLADLNTSFILRLPKGRDPAEVIALLSALPSVESVQPIPLVLLPTPPNLEPDQGYLNAATEGVNARVAWSVPGGTGGGVQVADIECDWNLNHADISATLIGPAPVDPDPARYANHGTAVLGIMAGHNNGWGVTGIAFDSNYYVIAVNTSDASNAAGSITTALSVLTWGDVLVLEMEIMGPDPNPGLVPIEWFESAYDAIQVAVGNHVIVVEAAGNGGQNLDDPKFNSGHAPFVPGHDSGAIMVGAGGPPGYPEGERARESFSTYGSRVDIQAWGDWVVTTGYGCPSPQSANCYSEEGTNFLYTGIFGGTSSATAIVGGACACLQGAFKARYATEPVHPVLLPAELRTLLKLTGSPQLDGTHPATEHIGPRPDLAAALPLALPTWVNFTATGYQDGSFVFPFQNLSSSLDVVPAGGTLNIFSGATDWTGTINQPVTIQAYGGTVTVGH
ncbi:MAG: S8 family serine peptidase [Verrucomicrobia bacterium]|nr:S8 family serine peptidase [Verrucomicrobiota bacterium]